MKKPALTSLVTASLFATVSIVFTQFLSFYLPFLGSNSVRIGFGHVPLLLAGLLLGPFWGAATGAVADFVGAVVFPVGGAYFPGFTITAMLTGLIPGLLKKYMGNRRLSWLHILSITLVTEVVVSVFLNTLWLSMIYGMDYWAALLVRLPITLCMCVVYAAINYPLYTRAFRELRRLNC